MKKVMILSLIAITFLFSCKKETDDERPVISGATINGVSGNDFAIEAGSEFQLVVSLSDNEALNQLKIDLHSADDGHSHEFTGGEEKTNEWEVFEVVSLSGRSQTISRSYTVPADQVGPFHLTLQCLDKEGNESALRLIELDIENSNSPVIQLDGTLPALNAEGEIESQVGGTVSLLGMVSDEDGLAEVHVELVVEGSDPEQVLWEEEYKTGGNTGFSLDAVSFVVPETTAHHLKLHIHAVDQLGFGSELELEIHIE